MSVGMSIWVVLAGVYVLIGLWAATLGFQAEKIRIDLRNFREGTIMDRAFNPDREPPAAWRWITFVVLVGGFVVLAWPIVWYQHRVERQAQAKYRAERRLGFSNMAGSGTLLCKDCGTKQKVVGFLHGSHEDPWHARGMQCQACHRIVTIKNDETTRCECGGELASDQPVLCPSCSGSSLTYELEFLT